MKVRASIYSLMKEKLCLTLWDMHLHGMVIDCASTAWYLGVLPRTCRSSGVHCVSKKFQPLNSLQLCHIITNFQNFCNAGNRMKFSTKLIRHYPLHLRHVASNLRKSKIQIFCRYSADMEENANKLHFCRL